MGGVLFWSPKFKLLSSEVAIVSIQDYEFKRPLRSKTYTRVCMRTCTHLPFVLKCSRFLLLLLILRIWYLRKAVWCDSLNKNDLPYKREKLVALNPCVDIGGWIIVLPLRLPLFSQLSMMNYFYITELLLLYYRIIWEKVWLLANSSLVCLPVWWWQGEFSRGNRLET